MVEGFRPTTANLLGRPLLTMQDVEAAYEAIAVAQVRRAELGSRAAGLPSNDATAGEDYRLTHTSDADILVLPDN